MDKELADRLAEVEEAFRAVEAELSQPEIASDPSRLAEFGKRHSELGAIVRLLEDWRRADRDRREALDSGGRRSTRAEAAAEEQAERWTVSARYGRR